MSQAVETTTIPLVEATTAGEPSTDPTQTPNYCIQDRHWLYFLASSLITFAAGLIIILVIRLFQYFRQCSTQQEQHVTPRSVSTTKPVVSKVSCATRLKWQCESLISGQTIPGRIMVSLSCILSVGSFVIYLIDASGGETQEETCHQWRETITIQIDFAFTVFFIIFFLIRFLAANDKLVFWLEIFSFVDYFTVPPFFVGLYLNRQWLGLRFMRILCVMTFPDILQYLRLLRTRQSIRLAQILSIFISTWLAASGLIHLLEITGDPFYNYENPQELTYWECVYFALVTMSTVGYGDIFCTTTLGRFFMTIFIIGALAMFASFIPEAIDLISFSKPYTGKYEKPTGARHIVVCGHITYESVQNFLRDFLHEDRENQNVKCIFLHSNQPDLELEALFKRHFTKVSFFKGTVMNSRDLNRVEIQTAEACLVMANSRSRDPDAEDAANIMRVISLKNFLNETRVIIQLMRYHNKAFCVNLPSWGNQDQVVCLTEMKLGFMAQGCLAPGFSTLLANLFVMRSSKKSLIQIPWQHHYTRGAGMEVYSGYFSPAFHGKCAPEVTEVCYSKLKLLLVAVALKKEGETFNKIVLNPGKDIFIDKETKGFFICQSEDQVTKCLHYCLTCHSNISAVQSIRPCGCSSKYKGTARNVYVNEAASVKMDDNGHGGIVSKERRSVSNSRQEPGGMPPQYSEVQISQNTDQLELFDSTGLFHWCKERSFESALLTSPDNKDILNNLEGHTVVCVLADSDTPLVGLSNFFMPLRASSFHREEIKPIVMVGNEEFLRREWVSLCNLPDVFIRPGSPLARHDIRSVKVNKAHMCVILSTNQTFTDDSSLIDKEAILCSLNIRTLKFNTLGDEGKSSPKRAVPASTQQQTRGRVKEDVLTRKTSSTPIPILTELANDDNVQFLDPDDEDDPDIPLYTTQSFACGRAFSASVLDSLMSTTYFNSEALSLIRTLITGDSTTELEEALAEGGGLVRGENSHVSLPTRNRSRVALIPMEDGILKEYGDDQYGTLFLGALRRYGILCLGLYRLIGPPATPDTRCVITNPPFDLPLQPSDKVYCLQSFVLKKTVSSPANENATHF